MARYAEIRAATHPGVRLAPDRGLLDAALVDEDSERGGEQLRRRGRREPRAADGRSPREGASGRIGPPALLQGSERDRTRSRAGAVIGLTRHR